MHLLVGWCLDSLRLLRVGRRVAHGGCGCCGDTVVGDEGNDDDDDPEPIQWSVAK